MKKLSYWIKERHNPQFDTPYYILFGQLTKKDAKRKENIIYGCNIMLEYTSKEDYDKAIKELKLKGFSVRGM